MLPRPQTKLLRAGISRLSSGYRCDNCSHGIFTLQWKECGRCLVYDLCVQCSPLDKEVYPTADSKHGTPKCDHGDWRLVTCIDIDERERLGGPPAQANMIREPKFDAILKRPIEKLTQHAVLGVVEYASAWEKKNGIHENSSQSVTCGATDNPATKASKLLYAYEKVNETCNILALDGGGVRGYLTMYIMQWLCDHVIQKPSERQLAYQAQFYDPADPLNRDLNQPPLSQREVLESRARQFEFSSRFKYFAGTSTGGLLGFCVAVNHPLSDISVTYSDPTYFKPNDKLFGFTDFTLSGVAKTFNWVKDTFVPSFIRSRLPTLPIFNAKYDPILIHNKIDSIIAYLIRRIQMEQHPELTDKLVRKAKEEAGFPEDKIKTFNDSDPTKRVGPQDFTFLDLQLYLNRKLDGMESPRGPHDPKRCLILSTFCCTTHEVKIYNSSYPLHYQIPIHHILKSTMAAPTYFPVYRCSLPLEPQSELLFCDGGIFANDPELMALYIAKVYEQRKTSYQLLSLGTGNYTGTFPNMYGGGYFDWLFRNPAGQLVNTTLIANGSFTQKISTDMASGANNRYRMNFDMATEMQLDDTTFCAALDKFMPRFEAKEARIDFDTLAWFYKKYIGFSNEPGKAVMRPAASASIVPAVTTQKA